MSSLKWSIATYSSSHIGHKELRNYYELWLDGTDKSIWYHSPLACIRRVKERCWELTFPEQLIGPRYYKTLKEAKAMGIVLTKLEN